METSDSSYSTYQKEMEVESNQKWVVISENPVPTIQRLGWENKHKFWYKFSFKKNIIEFSRRRLLHIEIFGVGGRGCGCYQ